MKILFQGDSITDAGRDYSDIHSLGTDTRNMRLKILKQHFPVPRLNL